MLIRKLSLLPFAFWLLCGLVWAQEPMTLEPGKPIEQEIAGGQAHTYQISATAGQFLRFRVEQRAVDATLILTAPDSKQLVEMNLTRAGQQESLSLETVATGSYRLTIQGSGSTALRGSYRLEATIQATVTRQDQKRLAAEALLIDANELAKQGGKTAQQVIDKQQQAVAIWRELNDPYWAAWSLSRIGNAYLALSQMEKAIEYYEQSLAMAREAKDRISEATALNNLSAAYGRLSKFEKTIEYSAQALVIRREMKDRIGEVTALNNLGNGFNFLSRYEKAIEYYEQALAITIENKDRNGEMLATGNLGVMHILLGQYEKGVEYHERALTISREARDRFREGTGLHNLGDAFFLLAQPNKGIEYLVQALAIKREIKDRSGEGGVLDNLGLVYQALNQNEKAIEYHEQALVISRELKIRHNEGFALNNLGNALRSLNQAEKATSYHEQALQIMREVKARVDEGFTLKNLMLDWKARNQPSLAVYFGKQSVNLYQEIRGNIRSLDQESQRSFLKSKEGAYRVLADLLIALGRLPEAEQVIRMLKEEEYFEYIRRDEANSPQSQKAALTPEEAALDKRYREIADKLTEIGTERGTLLDKKSRTPEEEQRLAKLEADLVVAGQAFQKFLDGLATEMGKNADTNVRGFQLRESQGLMEDLRELGKGVVALYTLVGEDKYRVILTTADFQRGYEFPIKAAELNRKVLAFRDVLQNPKLDPLPLAQELYKILVSPVAKDLQGTKAQMLMWSLDGVLRYLPVAALHDGKQYLVERYRTAVFTPASQSRLRVEPSRKWTALGLGVTKAHGLTIPALPGVLEEMHGIIHESGQETGAKTGVLPGLIKLDEAFTQEAMLTELRKRNPVVHIASHFRFQPGNETNSALLLGDGNFLSLAQIKSLPNVFAGVDLLTLSACNTATGGSGANGKEVEGFGVLAQRQGAKAVVASLWPVADRSTKNLMQEFYKLREAKADVTKAEALRQAQIRLLRGELQVTGEILAARSIVHEEDKTANLPKFKLDPKAPYAHPYYWAPFILIGNWK